MLNFFPTPYPDELWYSVLCRYHIWSGNHKNQTTRQELFNQNSKSLGIFFPNNTIYYIISQLPEELFDIKEIILNHTLLSYYIRMYPKEKKDELLLGLCNGMAVIPTNIWQMTEKNTAIFRYCPLCIKEDKEYIGESYWHREHQLPLMRACLKHRCRIYEYPCNRRGEANERFIHPMQIDIKSEPDFGISDMDIKLSELSSSYLRMPFDIGPTYGYNNLTQALYNDGYGTAKSYFSLNYNKIYNDLAIVFGKEIVDVCFKNKSAQIIIARIHNWSLMSPERYVLLSALIGQDADTTFSTDRIPDQMELKLASLKEKGIVFKKKYVAQQLDISPVQLDAAVARLGIKPFWKEASVYSANKKRFTVKSYYSKEEKDTIDQYAKDKNFANTSDFVKYCISHTMKEDLP